MTTTRDDEVIALALRIAIQVMEITTEPNASRDLEDMRRLLDRWDRLGRWTENGDAS